MEDLDVILQSDVDTASPWQLAQEAQAAQMLAQNKSVALRNLFEFYQELSYAKNGYDPLDRDPTRSARDRMMHYLGRSPYLRMTEEVRIRDLHEELRVVVAARRELADLLLLEDVQELLHSHLSRVQDYDALLDPFAARHLREKIARLLTNVGVPFVQSTELEDGE